MKRFRAAISLLLLLLIAGGWSQPPQIELKPRLTFAKNRIKPGETVEGTLTLTVPAPYHINANPASEDYLIPTKFTPDNAKDYQMKAIQYPAAEIRSFEFSDKPLKIYEGTVAIKFRLQVSQTAKAGTLKVSGKVNYQACDDHSCYPPQTRAVNASVQVVAAKKVGANTPDENATPGSRSDPKQSKALQGDQASTEKPEAASRGDSAQPGSRDQSTSDEKKDENQNGSAAFTPPGSDSGSATPGDSTGRGSGSNPTAPSSDRTASWGGFDLAAIIKTQFDRGNWLLLLGLLFLGGLLLNLTPCVYPLIPITLGFFGMQAQGVRSRHVGLTAAYALSMAATYSVLGTVASVAGKAFGFQFQNPWFVGGIVVIILLLALSMFDVYKLQVPAGIMQHVGARSGWFGAILMGTLAGFAAAPCIGPVIAVLIPIVAGLKSPLIGFVFFLALGLGLGSPYFVLGLYYEKAQGRLPRSGDWLILVERIFGVLLVATALFFAKTLIPNATLYAWLWVAMFAFFALYFLWIEREGEGTPRTAKFKHTLSGLLLGIALYSGYTLYSIPASASVSGRGAGGGAIVWERYSKDLIRQAAQQSKPVLIDFTADWCAACKELEDNTYSHPDVIRESERFIRLKMDATRDTPGNAAIQKDHGVRGLPTVIFIDTSGKERTDLRLTGFEPPVEFLKRLQSVK